MRSRSTSSPDISRSIQTKWSLDGVGVVFMWSRREGDVRNLMYGTWFVSTDWRTLRRVAPPRPPIRRNEPGSVHQVPYIAFPPTPHEHYAHPIERPLGLDRPGDVRARRRARAHPRDCRADHRQRL